MAIVDGVQLELNEDGVYSIPKVSGIPTFEGLDYLPFSRDTVQRAWPESNQYEARIQGVNCTVAILICGIA